MRENTTETVTSSEPAHRGHVVITMTRGDQRERDRQKTIKKQLAQNKGTTLPQGMSLAQKQALDAQIMQEKLKKAGEKKDTETKK